MVWKTAKGDVLSSEQIKELKQVFAAHLREPESLRRPEGIPTGIAVLDQFLFWQGLPKGALSLFSGPLGTGSTSLWMETAAKVIGEGKWAAWVDGEVPLSPLALHNKGVALERFVAIGLPEESTESVGKRDPNRLFWLLQELMSSSLFELIGCDLGSTRLKEHQLRKLQAQARDAKVALVFLSQRPLYRGAAAAVFALILKFEKRRLLIERAHHRPTPFSFPRSMTYARFTLHTADRLGIGTSVRAPKDQPIEQRQPGSQPHSLSRAAGSSGRGA